MLNWSDKKRCVRKANRKALQCEPLEDRHLLTTFTVAGTARWTDSGGNTHPIPLAEVQVIEHDLLTTSVIATGQTNLAGGYTLNVTHDDGILQGDPDISVRILAKSPVADVKDLSGDTYKLESAIVNEIAGGTTFTFSPTASNAVMGNDPKETAFSVHHALVVIGQYAGNLAGVTPSQIDVTYGTTTGTSFFRSADPSLTLLLDDRWDWDVIHHEYGHYFMNVHSIESNPGGNHGFGDNLSSTRGSEAVGLPLAWGEGWPTFFGTAGQQSTGSASLGVPNVGDVSYTDTIDSTNNVNLETSTGVGEDNELSVMAAIWDAFDSASGGGEQDSIVLNDRTMFRQIKGAGATTVGAAWDAIASPLSTADRTRLGEVFGHNKISPKLNGPADNTAMGNTPQTFTWDKNGGGTPNPLNDFRIRFYKSDFSSIVFEKDLGDVNTYTPTQADWDTIRAEATVKWVIEGRNTTGVKTPGGTLDYYWSGARTLGGVGIAMVIDDTGSMSEEIVGVRTALEQYIDALAAGLAPGADPPTIELLTFKDSVTSRITSNDLTAVRNAVSALRASGGGDCPEFSAHGLATAVESVAPGGTILLATDAAPQPGVDMTQVLARMRAKGITLNTILTGDCTGISSPLTADPSAAGPIRKAVETSRHSIDVSPFIPASKSDVAEPRSVKDDLNGVTRGGVVTKPGEDGHDDEDEPGVRIVDAGQPAIDDHGNSTAAATPLIVNGASLLGTVGLGDDVADFFAVDLTAGTRRVIELSEVGSTIRVEILDTDGTTTLTTRTVFRDTAIPIDVASTGTHFVKVTNAGSGVDEYTIAATDDGFAGLTSAVDIFSTISAQTGGTFLVRDGINAGNPDDFIASIFNVLASTLGPTVIAASPTDAPRGATLEINIEGRGTNWRPDDTTVAFSTAGIQVQNVDVTSPTTLRALVEIEASTPLGTHDVTVTTGFGETSQGLRVLEITPATTDPRLLTATPSRVLTGTGVTVKLFGANVAWDGTSTVSLGPDISVGEVRVVSPTELEADVTVDSLADIGFRTARVTTGPQAVALSRAIFVDVATAGIPQVVSVDPNTGGLNDTLTLSVTALNTSFEDGVTTASFGDGVEVVSVKVNSETEAEVEIKIADDAASGFRNVILNTGGEFAVLIAGFFVEGVNPVTPTTANDFQPAVSIFNANGSEVDGIEGVKLSASAFDVEDGDISSGLSWTSSRDGFLGTGANVTVPLSAGSHTITALSTDSGGLSGFDSITLFVPQSQVGVAIAGSIWDTPAVPLRENTSVATTSADRLIVAYASPPEMPPTIQVASSSGATVPAFLLAFWDGKLAEFNSLTPLLAGDYTATFTVPGSTKTVNFSIVAGTSNSSLSTDAVDNIFSGVTDEAPPALGPQLLPGDANGDGVVNFGDFSILAANFGRTDAALADGDLNGDNTVGFADFAIMAANFGRRIDPS